MCSGGGRTVKAPTRDRTEKGGALPTYVIRLTHTSDQCPTANSKARKRVQEIGPNITQIAERLGVKIVTGPLVLGAEHEGLAVLETERVETVNDFVTETGLLQWNSVRVSMARPLPDALEEIERMPAALY